MYDAALKNGQILHISRAVPGDAEEMIDFLDKTAGETDYMLYGKGERRITAEDEQKYLKTACISPSIMLCGKIGDHIAATCSLRAPKIARISHTCEMGIAVKREFWSLGAGSAMLSRLINFARQNGKTEIINLGVRSDNLKAMRLYEKFGFEKIGTYKNYFKIDGKYFDEIIMNLYL